MGTRMGTRMRTRMRDTDEDEPADSPPCPEQIYQRNQPTPTKRYTEIL
jgi:hypothetical protein